MQTDSQLAATSLLTTDLTPGVIYTNTHTHANTLTHSDRERLDRFIGLFIVPASMSVLSSSILVKQLCRCRLNLFLDAAHHKYIPLNDNIQAAQMFMRRDEVL